MNMVFVGAECAPWSKTGGLGDVMGSLPKAMQRRGHRVMVVAPRYGMYDDAFDTGVRQMYKCATQVSCRVHDYHTAFHEAPRHTIEPRFAWFGYFYLEHTTKKDAISEHLLKAHPGEGLSASAHGCRHSCTVAGDSPCIAFPWHPTRL